MTKQLRQAYNLTQKQLSDITKIPLRTIENWEGGKSKPKDYILNLISEFLKIKLGGIQMENLNLKLVEKLYDAMDMEYSYESAENDYNHDYLSENVGRDGNTYYWYLDEHHNNAINVTTGEIIGADKIDELF